MWNGLKEAEDIQALEHHLHIPVLHTPLRRQEVGLEGCDEDGVILRVLEMPVVLVLRPGDDQRRALVPKRIELGATE